MHWYFSAWRHYAKFDGRAGRREFWFFFLFNTIGLLCLVIIDLATGTFRRRFGVGLLGGTYILACFLRIWASQCAGSTTGINQGCGFSLLSSRTWACSFFTSCSHYRAIRVITASGRLRIRHKSSPPP